MSPASARDDAPPDRPRSGAAVAAVLVATLAWSTAPILVRSSELTGLRFAMYRLWAGVAIYAVVLVAVRRRPSWAAFRRSFPGGLIFGVDISLAFAAFKLTSVADATIIGALSPVAIALVSARLLGERVGPRERLLAAASFGGVALVAVGSSGSPSWSLVGDLAAVGSIGSWTAYWFYSRRARATVPAIEYMASVMVTAALVVTPVALAFGGGPLAPTASGWIDVVLVAAVPGFVGHTLVAWSHSHVESWRAALITQCHPIFATLLAWPFLGERVTPLVALGVVVVLAATGLVIVLADRDRRHVAAALDEAAEPAA
ncbi:MAG TPA: DMT family transporter [Actinomycetota bacterium]